MDSPANVFDLWAEEVRANPQAIYEQMRQEQPIYKAIGPVSGAPFWFFVNYADVQAVLKNQRFGKEARKYLEPEHYTRYGWSVEEDTGPWAIINRHMLNLDPPDHTRLRSLVHKAFTPRRVADLQPRIEQITQELLDQMADHNAVDLIDAFALPIPITVIAEMLGVPAADRERFRQWTDILLFSTDGDLNQQAAMEFGAFLINLVQERGQNPQDDIISALIEAEEDGERLNHEELLSMIWLLLVAGHETTVNLIGNGLLALIQHPDQYKLLVEDPGLIDTAVEELLRFNGPVETPTLRFAFDDIEVGGVTIPRGDAVLPSLLGANRDPLVFDNPNSLDIRRSPNPHIAFGLGIHYCVGAPLARLEGRIALNALVQRFPHITLNAAVEDLEWNRSLLLHGMKAMPVNLR